VEQAVASSSARSWPGPPPARRSAASPPSCPGHLRALLRDVLCGHLEPDLRRLADALLAQEGEQAGAEPEAVS
jgi:hypothetical protein